MKFRLQFWNYIIALLYIAFSTNITLPHIMKCGHNSSQLCIMYVIFGTQVCPRPPFGQVICTIYSMIYNQTWERKIQLAASKLKSNVTMVNTLKPLYDRIYYTSTPLHYSTLSVASFSTRWFLVFSLIIGLSVCMGVFMIAMTSVWFKRMLFLSRTDADNPYESTTNYDVISNIKYVSYCKKNIETYETVL